MTSCQAQDHSPQQTHPTIKVFLGKNVDNITGIAWKREGDGRLESMWAPPTPRKVVVVFPSGKELTFDAYDLVMYQQNSILVTVFIRLPIMTPDYQQALENMESEMAKLGFAHDPAFVAGLRELKTKEVVRMSLGIGEGCCAVKFEDGVKLRTGVIGIFHKMQDRWVPFLEFSVLRV